VCVVLNDRALVTACSGCEHLLALVADVSGRVDALEELLERMVTAAPDRPPDVDEDLLHHGRGTVVTA